MPAYTDPSQRKAEARAERHARALDHSRGVPRTDPRVLQYAAQGYLPVQIASMLNMSLADVRLMLPAQSEGRR